MGSSPIASTKQMYLKGKTVNVRKALNRLGIQGGVIRNDNLVTQCLWPNNHGSGDSHPSFSINIKTGKWICFAGCGRGSLPLLVRLYQNMEEDEAIRWLFSEAGAAVTFDQVSESFPFRIEGNSIKDETVNGSVEVAREDYRLLDSSVTSSYILERGYNMDTVNSWGMRYDRSLRAVGIPIQSIDDGLVGVVRRLVPPIMPGYPRYLYTSGFNRSKHLFGAHRHPRNGLTIVVEGPLDAIWLHQHGYTGAVALMGSYCSVEQIVLLKKLGSELLVALDNDSAGKEAEEHLISQLGSSIMVTVSEYSGKDVQELNVTQLEEMIANRRLTWSSGFVHGV